jgi:hypothetical protein
VREYLVELYEWIRQGGRFPCHTEQPMISMENATIHTLLAGLDGETYAVCASTLPEPDFIIFRVEGKFNLNRPA